MVFTCRTKNNMADTENADELLDYDEEEQETTAEGAGDAQQTKKDVKGTYVSIHSSGFRDFLLKPELLRAIVDRGFEHPSEGTTFKHMIHLINLLYRDK
jgi:hypothetical protein